MPARYRGTEDKTLKRFICVPNTVLIIYNKHPGEI